MRRNLKCNTYPILLVLLISLAAAILIGGCTQNNARTAGPGQQPQQAQPASQPANVPTGQAQTAAQPSAPPTRQSPPEAPEIEPLQIVEITATGFSPDTLTIKAGDAVSWVNKDSEPHWPASAVHPTHTAYPGSDINKCGTPEAADIFDACVDLAQDETFTFTFDQKGAWKYHDHRNPALKGTIIVE